MCLYLNFDKAADYTKASDGLEIEAEVVGGTHLRVVCGLQLAMSVHARPLPDSWC